MPYKLTSVAEMQAVEKEADANGLSYAQMMENAGQNLAEVVADECGYLEGDGICGLIGPGNNGGDALVALAILSEQGWPASAYLVRPRPPDDPLVLRLAKLGGQIYSGLEDRDFHQLRALLDENGIILDGVLGTGFRLPLKSELAHILEAAKRFIQEQDNTPLIVAVDCPSGVDCDSGETAPETIPADITVTMAAVKQGLLRFPANNFIGELRIVGIGLPEESPELPAWQAIQTFLPDAEWVRNVLPARLPDAHKGTFGTALVVAGSINYTGAAWLAGQAAYRVGTGLVTLAVPRSLHSILAGQFPEATWLLLPEEDDVIDRTASDVILENLERVSAMLIGPGFGQHIRTAEFVQRLLTGRPPGQMGFFQNKEQNTSHTPAELPPLVIDADGLKLLASVKEWANKLPVSSILTPHPGEMSILTGLTKEEIQADRLDTARRFSRDWGQIVILKGAFTVIASPLGQTAVIPVATPALARAGTGDVLAGMVVGLRAQGINAFEAAVAGAWIHAQAGWRAAEHLGNSASVVAGDLLPEIVQVISDELV